MLKQPKKSIYIGSKLYYLIYFLDCFSRDLEIDLEGRIFFASLILLILHQQIRIIYHSQQQFIHPIIVQKKWLRWYHSSLRGNWVVLHHSYVSQEQRAPASWANYTVQTFFTPLGFIKTAHMPIYGYIQPFIHVIKVYA